MVVAKLWLCEVPSESASFTQQRESLPIITLHFTPGALNDADRSYLSFTPQPLEVFHTLSMLSSGILAMLRNNKRLGSLTKSIWMEELGRIVLMEGDFHICMCILTYKWPNWITTALRHHSLGWISKGVHVGFEPRCWAQRWKMSPRACDFQTPGLCLFVQQYWLCSMDNQRQVSLLRQKQAMKTKGSILHQQQQKKNAQQNAHIWLICSLLRW